MEVLTRADAHIYDSDSDPQELVEECLASVSEECGVKITVGEIEKKTLASSVLGVKQRVTESSDLSGVYWFSFSFPTDNFSGINEQVREELRNIDRDDVKFQKVRTLGEMN